MAVVSGSSADGLAVGGGDGLPVFAGGVLYPHLAGDGGAGTLVTVQGAPCFCPGTLIAKHDGECPVEQLRVGDLVRTMAGADEPIRWIGRRSYAGRFLAGKSHLLPVRIRGGALGHGLPRRDLRVSPSHAMLLDGILVPAACLVNGTTIVREYDCNMVDYLHIELAAHDIILAEGAPTETFLDDGSRGLFHNAREYWDRHPDGPDPGPFCAPRVEDGFVLEAVRMRLAAVAMRLPVTELSDQPSFTAPWPA